MRVTSSMYYDSLYRKNNLNLNKELFDVNKQISSGLKIQYASDDVTTFSQTMRLDNEITTLTQLKKSTENGLKMSTQTDTIMNDFSNLMDRFKTLLIQAANDTNSTTSRDAISNELRGIEKNLRTLANSSINGRYLFAGSSENVKPIDDNGIYQGNDGSIEALVGSNNTVQFNMSGAELFLGENNSIKKTITTNVPNTNLLKEYPDLQIDSADEADTISLESTMRQLMGDTDNNDKPENTYYFYMRGVKSDGSSFSEKVSFSDNDTVQNLLEEIGNQYGNRGSNKVVNVSLNNAGEIVIEDKLNGSSKLDFHMVGAVDFDASLAPRAQESQLDFTGGPLLAGDSISIDIDVNGTPTTLTATWDGVTNVSEDDVLTDLADQIQTELRSVGSGDAVVSYDGTGTQGISIIGNTDGSAYTISNIDVSAASYADGVNTPEVLGIVGDEADIDDPLYADTGKIDNLDGGERDFDAIIAGTSTKTLFVKEFVLSGFGTSASSVTNLDGLVYDRAEFSKEGATITSNVAQVVKGSNEFAQPATKLSEVFDLSKGTAGTLDGTQLRLTGMSTDGITPYDITINLNSAGSTFEDNTTLPATSYDIFDMDPAGRSAVDADEMTYQQLLNVVNMAVTNNLPASAADTDYDSAIESSKVVAESYLTYDGHIAFRDLQNETTKATVSLYDANSGDFTADASVATFNANNSLTVNDPKNDFFRSIDEMIRSVEEYKTEPDALNGSYRVLGIQNSLSRIDDLQDHISSKHAKVGASSNTLEQSLGRVGLLELSAQELRSSTIDTDLAEASLTLQQLSLNYQALLSTVGKISQLSLVNYV